MNLRITTWNANSVRIRATCLERIVGEIAPDVLCLQETKVEDALFPVELCRQLGFEHVHVHGQRGYHGVATLSRLPLANPRTHHWCAIDHCRHAVVEVAGVEVHNLYVPAGGDVGDPEVNPKFKHKLGMVAELTTWFAARRGDGAKVVLLGDLNIAPLETDVWSHRQLLTVVSHTPVETEAMLAWQAAYGFIDALREVVPPAEKLFTWWSYRNRDWEASDRGRRLDHVWLSPALAPALRHAHVHKRARGWPDPSDHVPVTVELEVETDATVLPGS